MHWIALSLLSALFLGLFELSKKHAVEGNAVLPVLFLSTLCGAAVWATLIAFDAFVPGALPPSLVLDPLTPFQHLQLFAKSSIVACSWVCSYFALKHLPVSLAAPIGATGPLWTLFGALFVLAERPTAVEGAGIAVTLASFAALSLLGRREGVHFHRDKWVGLMFAGAVLGAVSALYDKFLLGRAGFSPSTVQAWFTIYLVVVFLPLAVGWKRRWWPRGEFHWRWSVPLIALTLLVADWVYFSALREPEALISLVSSLRRGSTLVAFAGGLLLFKEANGLAKLPAVIGLVAGIALIVAG